VMGITWWLTSMVIIAIAARFYVRTRMVKALGADDYLMLLAGVSFKSSSKLQSCIDCSYSSFK
jgi:hypothetical protein